MKPRKLLLPLLFLILISTISILFVKVKSKPNSVPNSVVKPLEMTSNLPNYGPAPELTNENWLNTSKNPELSNLKGNVILLEMWTFG